MASMETLLLEAEPVVESAAALTEIETEPAEKRFSDIESHSVPNQHMNKGLMIFRFKMLILV